MTELLHDKSVPLAAMALLATASFCAPLAAQRMAIPTDPQRELRLFDLHRIYQGADGRPSDMGEQTRARIAEFLRPFVQPALRDGDDLEVLGGRWLAVLADAERTASVDRILQAAQQHRDDLLQVEVRLFEVEPDAFDEGLRARLVAVGEAAERSYEAVLPREDVAGFVETCEKIGGNQLQAPRIAVRPLMAADIRTETQISYISDFRLEKAGDAMVANPIVETTWDGVRSTTMATILPDGLIGLSCSVHVREVQRPMPQAEVQLLPDVAPATVQLPRASGVRLQNTAQVHPGSLVVLAGLQSTGDYLVALVRADVVRPR